MASTPLSPEHALAYLRELQPMAREVALVGPGGALLAGEEGRSAEAARVLQRAGGERSVEGELLAVGVAGHAIAAVLPDAEGALAEYDLEAVASAVDVRFGG
jgi:hypothetical protein